MTYRELEIWALKVKCAQVPSNNEIWGILSFSFYKWNTSADSHEQIENWICFSCSEIEQSKADLPSTAEIIQGKLDKEWMGFLC